MGDWWHNDDMVDAHYSRGYYGPGTDYFDPPEWDDLDTVFEDDDVPCDEDEINLEEVFNNE